MKNIIEMFFIRAVDAIREEEETLNHLFVENCKHYPKNHYGVCNLYETTYVYLVFKKLLETKFPLTFSWEYPYPGNQFEHCDAALLGADEKLDSLIEFKLWLTDDDKAIKADVLKLQKVGNEYRKYLFVIGYGGDIKENIDFLLRNSLMKSVESERIITKFFNTEQSKIIDMPLNLMLFEVI
jgi:hypothetical protein